jgi:hypothetical protein
MGRLSLCLRTQGRYLTPRVINLAMQYLTTAVSLGATWKALKPHVPQLLAAVVFPLCCFNDEDAELWAEDPQEYIRKARVALRTVK